jgi:small subunit ribosomal protein S20
VANHASALKAHRQNVVNRERNRQLRSRLRSALKSLRTSLVAGKADEAKGSLSQTVSLIDRMVTKGVIHRNAGARYKSRLTLRLRKLAAAA